MLHVRGVYRWVSCLMAPASAGGVSMCAARGFLGALFVARCCKRLRNSQLNENEHDPRLIHGRAQSIQEDRMVRRLVPTLLFALLLSALGIAMLVWGGQELWTNWSQTATAQGRVSNYISGEMPGDDDT